MTDALDRNDKFLEYSQIEELFGLLRTLPEGGGRRNIYIYSDWNGEQKWGRNRGLVSSDRRNVWVGIGCEKNRRRSGLVLTNQIDAASLKSLMRYTERLTRVAKAVIPYERYYPVADLNKIDSAVTWSDSTAFRAAESNGNMIKDLVAASRERELLAFGFVQTSILTRGMCWLDEDSNIRDPIFSRATTTECSMTVRDPNGTASGWAGRSGFDFDMIDTEQIANSALEKCVASLDSVRIEPGRYTVILEPQAVSDLVDLFLNGSYFNRISAEEGRTVLSLPGINSSINRFHSKLGLKVIDERISIYHDPADPLLGIPSRSGLVRVEWIKNGVLNALASEHYGRLNENVSDSTDIWRSSYRMTGGETPVDSMIRDSQRALLVTRLVRAKLVDKASVLGTGLTRDGCWLIENGKITKSIRNFRWTESPLFILNNVEQLGSPELVFRPAFKEEAFPFLPEQALRAVVVPPMKVRDFSMTSTIEAV